MENKNWLAALDEKNQLAYLQEANQYTKKYGLTLTQEQALLLLEARREVLRTEERVEFGKGILSKLIYAFCDSDYIHSDDWADTLGRLTEIFFLFKNEMHDEITDDELVTFMREQFDDICRGDLDYLEGTCLDIFAQAIRAGYRGYTKSGGSGEYEAFDLLPRWSRGEYLAALNELCQ